MTGEFILKSAHGNATGRQESVEVDEESALMVFESKTTGDKIGVQMNADGTFTVGGWNDKGEWVDLGLSPAVFGTRHDFPLNQFDGDL